MFILDCTKKLLSYFCVLGVFFLCLFCQAYGLENKAAKKNVLMVSSHNLQTAWGKMIVEGFNSAFSYDKYSINYVGLSDAHGQATMSTDECFDIIDRKIKNSPFDIIVVFDPLAIDVFEKKLDLFPQEIEIILANATDQTQEKLADKKNVFVSVTYIDAENNINLGLKLFPNARRMVVFSDNSDDGILGEKTIKEAVAKMIEDGETTGEAESNIKSLEIVYINGGEYSSVEALKKLSELTEEPCFVLFYLWSSPKDTAGSLSFQEFAAKISEIADKNVINFFDDTPNNIIGGYMLSGVQYASFIGQKAKEVLNGATELDFSSVKRLPMLNINWNTFTEKNFKVEMIPDSAVFYYEKRAIWETIDYRYVSAALAIAVLLLISVVILSYFAILSSRRSSVFFKNMPSDIFVFSEDGKVRYSYCKSPSGKSIKSVFEFGADFERAYKKNLQKINDGEQCAIEFTYKGQRQKSLVARVPQRIFGDNIYITTSVDITDLENAKSNFKELALRMKTTLASIGDAVLISNNEGTITFSNQMAQKLLGYGDEIVGRRLDDVYKVFNYENKTQLPSLSQRVRMSKEENDLLANNKYFVSREDKLYHVSDTVSPIVMNDTVIGSILVFKDISDEYAKSAEINIKNYFLERATTIANISYFRCDEGFKAIGGLPKNFLGMEDSSEVSFFPDLLGKEERAEFLSKWADFLKNSSKEFEEHFHCDYFGERRYYDIHVTASADISGEFFAVIKDVTKIKKRDLLISDTNRILNTLIDNFPCAVFVKNYSDEGRYVLHNKCFPEQMGLNGDDFRGMRSRDIFPQSGASVIETEEEHIVKTGDVLDCMRASAHPSGDVTTVRIIKKAITMENGDTYIMGMAIDVTEHIRSKKELELYAIQQKVINDCLSFAIKSYNPNETITEVLKLLCNTMKSDRAFVFRYDEENDEIHNTHYWNSDNCKHKSFNIKRISTKIGKVLIESLSRGEIISFNNSMCTAEYSELHQLMSSDGIKVSMVAGFFEEGKLAGFIGADYVNSTHTYTDYDKNLLRNIAKIIDLDLERHRLLKKNIKAENERRLILDSIHVPIMLFDANAKLLTLNNAAANLVDKSRAQLMCEPCAENFCANKYSDAHVCPVKRAIKERKTIHVEMNLMGKNIIATGTPVFDENGELINVIESDTDVTDIVEINKKLQEAIKAAQESEKAKSFFLATMSHELRTPLNAVIGYSELTQNPKLEQEERILNLKHINFAANTLLNLINDILDLSKLEAGHLEIKNTLVEIEPTMEEFSGVFKFALDKKNLYFKTHIENEIPPVMMDMLRLKQILMNLIGNAVKFTNKGGIDVTIAFDEKSSKFGDLRISIKDSGIGISKSSIATIFDPFVQDNTKRIRGNGGYAGTGLGLSIVKRLMEKMNGGISVESEDGKGSTFKLYFKNIEIASAEDLEKMKNERLEFRPVEVKSKGMNSTVLIVDDILLNTKMLKHMLNAMGLNVIDTLDSSKVMDILKTSKPDIIMTDLWMPQMNGEDLARKIKSNPETASIPIIAVTADSQVQDPDNVFSDILFKPITMNSISEILKKWLPDISEESYAENSFKG